MKWKIFERNNSGNSRQKNLEEYEKDYISRIKEDIDSEFIWLGDIIMSLSKATVSELDRLDLRDFQEGQKFLRMAKRLQSPERIFLKKVYNDRLRLLESAML